MSWNKERAMTRIDRLVASIPASSVGVENFSEQYFPRRLEQRYTASMLGESQGPPILQLPYQSAILVEGVHVYANLIDFNDHLMEDGRETEASHRRTLQFLNLHYATCDALIEEFDIQRVDYHGARLHAVVATPVGADQAGARAIRAVAFAEALTRLMEEANRRFAGGRLGSSVRIGLDSGLSVAINSGRGTESDPLFLGNPANRAAKLAEGKVPGVFPSRQVRADLGASPTAYPFREDLSGLDAPYRDSLFAHARAEEFSQRATLRLMENVNLQNVVAPHAAFHFRHARPPLKSIQFAELMPSNSVRMLMMTIFADLDGFTRYVSDSIKSGNIAQMVARLHVMRGEMNCVLRDDFGGKKVRFIGDCLQGIVAEGNSQAVDEVASVDQAVRCAAALRSSFKLCDDKLGRSSLGLGIGIELGTVPVTRLGGNGNFSVRCATSHGTIEAEDEQKQCRGNETAIGEQAFENGTVKVRNLFRNIRKARNLFYEQIPTYLDSTDKGIRTRAPSGRQRPQFRAHSRI